MRIDAAGGAGPGRKRRTACLVALASGVLSLALAEIVARRVFGTPIAERLPILEVRAHRTRGFEMIPGGDHFTYLHPVRVNRLGLRGPDLPEKGPGEVRVLCLGDSLVYGQGVAEADTIPARLEKALGPNVRAVNGGLRAYGTRHELALLEELAPAIRPDLVVLFWYENDLEWPDVEGAFESLSRSGPVAFDTGERMEGGALLWWRVKQTLRRSALVMEVHDLCGGLAYEQLTPQEVEEGWARLDLDLGAFQRLSRELSFGFAVVAVPASGAVAGHDPSLAAVARAGEVARRHGLPFLDPTDALREASRRDPEPFVLPFDGHYTGTANAAIADAVARLLRERFPERFPR